MSSEPIDGQDLVAAYEARVGELEQRIVLQAAVQRAVVRDRDRLTERVRDLTAEVEALRERATERPDTGDSDGATSPSNGQVRHGAPLPDPPPPLVAGREPV